MIEPLARSRSFERMISPLDKIIENTADYFDDKLTARVNITKAWFNDALLTVRQHELQRIKLVNEIYDLSRKSQIPIGTFPQMVERVRTP